MENSYKQWIEEMASKSTKLDIGANTFERQFTMDDALYEHIIDLNEAGDYIDFEIPPDAPQGRKYSEIIAGREAEEIPSDLVPVDLKQEFGRGDLDG